MSDNTVATHPKYDQPSKHAARVAALKHAVQLLTIRRNACALVPEDYISRVIAKMKSPASHRDYKIAAKKCKDEDIKSWQAFRASSVGKRDAGDLTVAYLAGPEPTNDLKILIELGVRPENIWAFEIDKKLFPSAVDDIGRSIFRGVKLMNVSIEDYFLATPRRFDIIYFDACAPLPSRDQKTTQAIVNVFRYSALAPLGVLVTNFSSPDISKTETIESYGHLVGAYLYPKAFLDTFDNPKHTYTDGATAHGYSLAIPGYECTEDVGDQDNILGDAESQGDSKKEKDEYFFNIVKSNFIDYYGSFITRHILDIASIIAPSVRLMNGALCNEIVTDFKKASKRARRFVAFNEEALAQPVDLDDPDENSETIDIDGDALSEPSMYSLLYTLAACGLLEECDSFYVPENVKKFCGAWANQLSGKHRDILTATDAIACFYSLRHDTAFWANAMKRVASFDYGKHMPFLCDVPTEELGFYPVFAQVAYPAHNNVAETRRYRYVAEGKQTTMLLDVLPFDECRYVYDWLATAQLIDNDWLDESRQLVFRFALDRIAKINRWYQDDFLYGCHAIGIDNGYFDPPTYSLREDISASPDETDSAVLGITATPLAPEEALRS